MHNLVMLGCQWCLDLGICHAKQRIHCLERQAWGRVKSVSFVCSLILRWGGGNVRYSPFVSGTRNQTKKNMAKQKLPKSRYVP